MANEPVLLNAQGGQLRLQPTQVWGRLNSATAGSASLDLLTLGGWPPNSFDFTGTGPTPVTAAAYPVSTGTFDEAGVAAGTPLELSGYITPFGSAPPAFDATAVVPGSASLQQLVIEWTNGGTLTPFTSDDSNGLVVNLKDPVLDDTRFIRTGPSNLDILALPASPLITAVGASGPLLFAIGSDVSTTVGISVYNDFRSFIGKVQDTFASDNTVNKIYRLVAYGQYNSTTNTFVASRIYVALQET